MMVAINWYLVFQIIIAISTAIIAFVAVRTFTIQWGAKLRADKLEKELEVLENKAETFVSFIESAIKSYYQIMASESGIVLSGYKNNEEFICNEVSNKLQIPHQIVKEILDKLYKEGKIE